MGAAQSTFMWNVEDIEDINREQLVTPLDRLLFRGELMTRHASARRRPPAPAQLPMLVAVLPNAPQPPYANYFGFAALFAVACFAVMLAVMASML